MNNGTKIRTVLVIATCFNTALMATDIAQFHNPTLDLVYRILSVIANFVIVFCATWFNNDYTEEACIGTGVTRQLKAEGKADYVGDYFYIEDDDDIIDCDEEEGAEDESDDMEADRQ